MIQIPWHDSDDFQFEIALDRVVYLMRLRWNDVAGSYVMDLLTRNKVPVSLGTRLVAGTSLMEVVTNFSPPGRFYVLGEDPTLDRFLSGACTFVYLTAAEMAEAA